MNQYFASELSYLHTYQQFSQHQLLRRPSRVRRIRSLLKSLLLKWCAGPNGFSNTKLQNIVRNGKFLS